jgi:hypothetical protein
MEWGESLEWHKRPISRYKLDAKPPIGPYSASCLACLRRFFEEIGQNGLDFKLALVYDQDFKTDYDIHFEY